MHDPQTQILVWLVVYLVAAGVLIRESMKQQVSSGLVLGYIVTFSYLHLSAVTYLDDGYANFDPGLIALGFRQAAIGLAAFAAGATLLLPLIQRLHRSRKDETVHEIPRGLPRIYLVIGLICGVGLASGIGGLPTLEALFAVGSGLTTVALLLFCWKAYHNREWGRLSLYLFLVFVMPLVTIVNEGFLGFGTGLVIVVGSFLVAIVKNKRLAFIAIPLVAYLGLSVFVTYMRDREAIRQVVWGGRPFNERVDRVTETFTTLEWFSPTNADHQRRIDDRLNQNYLVGVSVQFLSDTGTYARGGTIRDSLLALVPRAIWPEKPVVAGSGTLVTEATGIPVAGDTSVGIGHTLEFYFNFGTVGVILGFLLFGVVLMQLDQSAGRKLRSGDWHGFALMYSIGWAFLPTAGGSLVELTAAAGATVLLLTVINRLYLHRLRRPSRDATAAMEAVARPVSP